VLERLLLLKMKLYAVKFITDYAFLIVWIALPATEATAS